MSTITLKQLFEARVHFGHRTRFREPRMSPYIYGARHGISIINLKITRDCLQTALEFVANVVERPGGKILFVGTKRSAQEAIKRAALACGMPYVDRRWPGGLLTNYRNIRQSVKRYKDLLAITQDNRINQLTKKEALTLARQLAKLERSIGGIKDMGGLPDALLVVDVGYESIAVTEARKLKIPVIGIVDTNHLPEGVDYIIPGNDDAITAIELYVMLFSQTILSVRTQHDLKPELETVSESNLHEDPESSTDTDSQE